MATPIALRRRLTGMALDAALRGLSATAQLHPLARPDRHGVEVARDVRYSRSSLRAHTLDVYRRAVGASKLAPVVLHVHGGGFRILSKDTHWMMGLGFAREGLVVFNINYRLAPAHPFPAGLEDVCAAYEWVLDHAAEWGGDPSRVIVAGESAGANLTTALVVATCFERDEPYARRVFARETTPVAALPFCGLLEVSRPERFFAGTSSFVRDRIHEIHRAYLPEGAPPGSLCDPLTILESDVQPARPLPPFFAAVGDADPVRDDTMRLERALRRRGVDVEAPVYPGAGHAFHAMVFRETARACWRDVHRFVAERVDGR